MAPRPLFYYITDREARRPRTENRELRTRLLINSRTDVALAAGADGVHLRSDDVSPSDVREAWKCGAPARETASQHPIIGVSCHPQRESKNPPKMQPDFPGFPPVLKKKKSETTTPAGLPPLQGAC